MSKPKRLTEHEYTSLRFYLGSHPTPMNIALEILLRTGVRQNECVKLRKSDFYLDRGMVHVRGSKHSNDRLVPLAKDFVERLRPWLETMGNRTVGMTLSDASLGVSTHTRMIRRGFKDAMGKALGKPATEIPYGAHSLRHTFAMRFMRAAGMDVLKTQLALGHKSLSTTAFYLNFLTFEDIEKDILNAVG